MTIECMLVKAQGVRARLARQSVLGIPTVRGIATAQRMTPRY